MKCRFEEQTTIRFVRWLSLNGLAAIRCSPSFVSPVSHFALAVRHLCRLFLCFAFAVHRHLFLIHVCQFLFCVAGFLFIVRGCRFLVCRSPFMVAGFLFVVRGCRFLVRSFPFTVAGFSFVVHGCWFLVPPFSVCRCQFLAHRSETANPETEK